MKKGYLWMPAIFPVLGITKTFKTDIFCIDSYAFNDNKRTYTIRTPFETLTSQRDRCYEIAQSLGGEEENGMIDAVVFADLCLYPLIISYADYILSFLIYLFNTQIQLTKESKKKRKIQV